MVVLHHVCAPAFSLFKRTRNKKEVGVNIHKKHYGQLYTDNAPK